MRKHPGQHWVLLSLQKHGYLGIKSQGDNGMQPGKSGLQRRWGMLTQLQLRAGNIPWESPSQH